MVYNILFNSTEFSYLQILLYIVVIICGIYLLVTKNLIVAIISFIIIYVNTSIYLYSINMSVVGLLYILIYVGAITILLLFILTLININTYEKTYIAYRHNSTYYILLSINMVILAILYIYYIVYDTSFINVSIHNNIIHSIYGIIDTMTNLYDFSAPITAIHNIFVYTIENDIIITPYIQNVTTIKGIGTLLYTEYSIIFILLAIVLLLSIIGAIILLYDSKKR
uniref:NADH-ubiquinone oxidoreductase chain 6 n=1 Tax=Diddensiella santjacobensis TaxID=2704139 RepID=S5TE18_9ASCO|nr:NADH dehydrogenase subunit 6 [Diddensiella santjacobensis]AGS44134.1 NADH dehydrogenase subunit 6 [Diddensiella santjacobensis]